MVKQGCHGIVFVVCNHSGVCPVDVYYFVFPILLSSYIFVSKQVCKVQFQCDIMHFERV